VTIIVIIIQVLSALGLVFLVLLHSGKGGGLSDMFGGGMGASAAGSTVVEKNLDRLTVVTALIWVFATVRPSCGRMRGPYVLKIRTMHVSTPCWRW
jgi:preprotein translocase subunit SecG